MSDGITNQIKEFNQSTVHKLEKFIKENNIKDQKVASENKAGFSAEKSEDSNETIKKLIDKISKSEVDQTEFAKLLVEITKDQSQMNEEIKKSSQKISKLAEEINKEHVVKVYKFCTKINDTLVTVKVNEKTLLEMKENHEKELVSNFKKIFKENFLKEEDTEKLEDLKEKFKNNKSFKKVFTFIFSEPESKNQDFGEDEILVIK